MYFLQFSAAYLNWRQLNLEQEHRFEMGQSWWGCYLLDAYYRSVSIKFKLVHFVCIGILSFAEWASIWIPTVRCVTLTSRLGKAKANQRRWKSNFLFCEKGEPFFFYIYLLVQQDNISWKSFSDPYYKFSLRMNDKVIALIDMDCFYVQVTEPSDRKRNN